VEVRAEVFVEVLLEVPVEVDSVEAEAAGVVVSAEVEAEVGSVAVVAAELNRI